MLVDVCFFQMNEARVARAAVTCWRER